MALYFEPIPEYGNQYAIVEYKHGWFGVADRNGFNLHLPFNNLLRESYPSIEMAKASFDIYMVDFNTKEGEV